MMNLLPEIHNVLNITILVFLVVTAIAVVRSQNLLNSTILLGIFSLLMATEYLVLSAPDVAITEAAVGAGFSTILLLLGLFLVGEKEKKPEGRKFFAVFVIMAVTAVLVYATGQMPIFGASDTPAQTHVAAYYLANSGAEIGIPNTVTSILASYRGYDTLGEVVVIFTAGIAVLMLLGKRVK